MYIEEVLVTIHTQELLQRVDVNVKNVFQSTAPSTTDGGLTAVLAH